MDPLILPAALFAAIMATLPPCQFEDSTNCAWDAAIQGNGDGNSFFDLEGVVYYGADDAPIFNLTGKAA